MSVTGNQGPLVIWGQPTPTGNANPDLGPSVFYQGTTLFDLRYNYVQDTPSTGGVRAFGYYCGGGLVAIDQVPSTSQTFSLSAAAATVSGTPVTLVTGTSGGISSVTTGGITIPQTRNTVSTGLVIDSLPTTIAFGQTGAVTIADPTTALARAVQVTSVTGSPGGDFRVVGADLYGYPMTESITSPAGAFTTAGNKAFKFVTSVTPSFTDAGNNYSIGVSDKIGFPLRVDRFAYAAVYYSDTAVTATAGFVAATTSASGDVRGTYTLQQASNGIRRVQVFIEIPPQNCTTVLGLFGPAPT